MLGGMNSSATVSLLALDTSVANAFYVSGSPYAQTPSCCTAFDGDFRKHLNGDEVTITSIQRAHDIDLVFTRNYSNDL